MAKPQRTEAQKVPVQIDVPHDLSRAEEQAVGAALAREYAAGRLKSDPEGSAQHDEHRGLAARILDLRKTVEDNRLHAVREHHELKQRMAQLEQQVTAMGTRIDREVEEISRKQRDLDTALRDGGEQVRVAGELSRKMTGQVQELAELRAMAADPHEVVKPLRHSLAVLRGDLEALGRTIDIRFEQLPKSRATPVEMRGEDEDAFVKMGAEIRALKTRVKTLESD